MHDDVSVSKVSNNRSLADVLSAVQARRSHLRVSTVAAAGFSAGGSIEVLADGLRGDGKSKHSLVNVAPGPLTGGSGNTPRISSDYNFQVLIPWGTSIAPCSTETVGIGHDGLWFFPLGRGNWQSVYGLLCINHEFGDNLIVIGKNTPTGLEDVRKSQYAHGMSVVEIVREKGLNGSWDVVSAGGFARRIHANSPMKFGGPVTHSPLLHNPANNPALGTLNNGANGYTPWGTYLTCEENFNGYFGAKSAWTPTNMHRRYGFTANGFGCGWHQFDERFDLSNPNYVNEVNRFGWIVEVDPMQPNSTPVKRTALGRFKHEGIALTVGRGNRVVGYMGDDERFDYIYKFISDDNWQSMRKRGLSPLDYGKLYVANFNDNGTGQWLELTLDNPILQAEFKSQAEVLTYARRASDLLGATPMDRPKWITVAPNGLVSCALTNNSTLDRTGLPGADAANRLASYPDGHIIRWLDSNQHIGLTFHWEISALAQDTEGTESSFVTPDGLCADTNGRLLIETDGSQNVGFNDQLLVADIYRREINRLSESMWGAEVAGLTLTPDRKTLFCNLHHPDPASALPKDATIVITRKDGAVVGS